MKTSKNENILMSPSSIASILAMTLAGAEGSTAKQIKAALKLPQTRDNSIMCAIGQLTRRVNTISDDQDFFL